MAASSNVQLNQWADQRVRPLCDKIDQLIYAITAYEADYAAQGIAALITSDGAGNNEGNQDGRIPITGTQVVNLKAALDQLNTAATVTLVTGVGATVKAIVDAMQVNGSPR
ncbi:MAG TPA: hypothetical protein VK797_23220 [Tepidisphaeraceae bacterium]|jgi:hypothetical protein|nr:hypothetical protein [Tepidisphaeraceae bacterium]